MPVIIFFIVHWYLSLFFQTFFHHRYAAHRMFTMSKFWEKVFHFSAFIAQGSSYLSPSAYGILHRLHHQHADTEEDPHSPKYDKNIMAMMWRTKVLYSSILKGKTKVADHLKRNLPGWTKFDLVADHVAIRLLWVAAYAAFYIYFDAAWWMYFTLLPIQAVMGPFHGVIINWFAHKYGYENFKTKDTSKNLLPLDVLMLGESYHNNHHGRAKSANFGYKWWEIDPVYIAIWVFDKVGIIKLVPQQQQQA
jgi:stearoyl-CoA desaturase (delta-9 desaturase)